ncbi:MAG TPA: FAD-dependent monooxygenase [Gammaproteobacteria bacterium]|nr:FAD-dependent monooxygenase [Gammaproteobacteria bacterium]
MKEVVILGGGVVGGLLALKLHLLEFQVTLIERRSLAGIFAITTSRTFALNAKSANILRYWDVWPAQAQENPIVEVHIAQHGSFVQSKLCAKDYNLKALGYSIPQHILEQYIYQSLAQCHIKILENCEIIALKEEKEDWQLTCQQQEKVFNLTASFLIVADGQHSTTREMLHLPAHTVDFPQKAWVGEAQLTQSHNHIAYELFTEQGAVALLPLSSDRATIVWTLPLEEDHTMQREQALAHLGDYLARFKVELKSFKGLANFPLSCTYAPQQVIKNAILMGNAAHSLHPIAAQGLNVSIADVATLLHLLEERREEKLQDILEQYQKQRLPFQQGKIWYTNFLAHWIASDKLPTWVKHVSLGGFELFTPLKHIFGQFNMGF